MVFYQCPFHPNNIYYTKDDLVTHCKINHVICDICPSSMCFDKDALEAHYRRRHPKSPPPKVQPAATSSPTPAYKPEFEQVEPGDGDKAKTQPQQQQTDQQAPVSESNVHPDRDPVGRYICNLCKQTCGTLADFKLHLNIHRKVLCKFCFRKFLNTSSLTKHVDEVHKDSQVPQYHCKIESCKEQFRTQKESFRHLRLKHRDLFKYRCKKCKDSFHTVEELFRHGKLHDTHHLPFEAKWRCSRCGEVFDNLNQLMEHTRTHTQNWRFSSISELTIHGREFHNTREHSCYWCTRYFVTPELLLQHRNKEHTFECRVGVPRAGNFLTPPSKSPGFSRNDLQC